MVTRTDLSKICPKWRCIRESIRLWWLLDVDMSIVSVH